MRAVITMRDTDDGRLVMVKGSGHYIQVDQPQVVIDAIREVVEAVRH
jgi:pimeloyl-ACP methyl ester carboxylesterase